MGIEHIEPLKDLSIQVFGSLLLLLPLPRPAFQQHKSNKKPLSRDAQYCHTSSTIFSNNGSAAIFVLLTDLSPFPRAVIIK